MGGGLRAVPPEVTSRARRQALHDRAGPGPQAHSDVPVHRARLYKNPVIQDHAMDGGMITITADTITLKAGTINLDPK